MGLSYAELRGLGDADAPAPDAPLFSQPFSLPVPAPHKSLAQKILEMNLADEKAKLLRKKPSLSPLIISDAAPALPTAPPPPPPPPATPWGKYALAAVGVYVAARVVAGRRRKNPARYHGRRKRGRS